MIKIKLLVFTNSFRAGGSERQAVELVKRLDPSRFSPMVACFDKEGPLLSELPPNIHIEAFPLNGFLHWSALSAAIRFALFIRRSEFELVQCFDFYSNLFAIPLSRLSSLRVIGCRRDEASMRTRWQHRAELLAYKFATCVLANAEVIKEQLVSRDKLKPEKVCVIQNGLDLARFDTCRQSPIDMPVETLPGPVIAVVANLRPEKGHLVLLAAAHRLMKRLPSLKLLIVGNGPMKEIIGQRIKELNLESSAKMMGEVKNVPAFLKAIHIAVLPSLKNEGFPNSVMEAMAASVPVVATDTGGTSELVVDGLTGYLVPPGDPEALQDRLGKLCADPELRKKMGEAGRQRIIECFTADRMVRRFESLYEVLVKGNAG